MKGRVTPGSVTVTLDISGAEITSTESIEIALDFNGTAVAGDVNETTPISVTIPAADYTTPGTVDVALDFVGDAITEADETFDIDLSSPSTNTNIGTTINNATVTITNDDELTVDFSSATYSANEGSSGTPGSVTVTLDISGAEITSTESIEIALDFNGTAVAGDVNETTPISVTIPVADYTTPGTVDVALDFVGDAITEADETFDIDLSSPSTNTNIGTTINNATVTITNDDELTVDFSSATYSANEGSSGTPGSVTVTLDISGAEITSTESIEIALDFNGTAVAGDVNETTPISVTIPAADYTTPGTVDVALDFVGDAITEADETFDIDLSSPSTNTNIGTTINNATVTITNDDELTVDFSSATYSANEGSSGTPGSVTVTLDISGAEITSTESIEIALDFNGTAVAGDVNETTPISVTIPAGDYTTPGTVDVVLDFVGDAITEGDETFEIVLSNPSGNTNIGTLSNATVTITNDDAAVVTSVSVPADGTYAIGEDLTFTVIFNNDVTFVDNSNGITLGLTFGSGSVTADYVDGSSTVTNKVFTYTVQENDEDTDGITVGSISLNGDEFNDFNGDPAVLTLNGVGSTANVTVDGIRPTFQSASVEHDAPADIVVVFSENISTNGTGFVIDVDGTTFVPAPAINSFTVSGTGSSTITFTLSSPVPSPDGTLGDVTIAYNDPAANDATDDNGNTMSTFGAQTVTNNIVPVAANFTANCLIDGINLSWTAPVGAQGTEWDGVLVFAKQAGAVDIVSPTNEDPSVFGSASTVFGDGTETGTGNFLMYSSTSDLDGDLDMNGFTANTTYHFAIYVYRDNGGGDFDWSEVQTVSDEPTILEGFSAVSGVGVVDLAWSFPDDVSCVSNVVIFASEGPIGTINKNSIQNPAGISPDDFVANSNWGTRSNTNDVFEVSNVIAGFQDNQFYVVHNGDNSTGSTQITNVPDGTELNFRIFLMGPTSATENPNLDVSVALETQSTTLAEPEPVTDLVVSCNSSNEITLTWTKPTGVNGLDWDGVLVYADQGGIASVQDFTSELAPVANPAGVFGDESADNTSFLVANLTADANGNLTISGFNGNSDIEFTIYSYRVTGGSSDVFSSASTTPIITPEGISSINAIQGDTIITLEWTNPSTDPCDFEVLVIGTQASGIDANIEQANFNLEDFSTITLDADANFGNGRDINDNIGGVPDNTHFVVYRGTGEEVTVTGLTNSVDYTFRFFIIGTDNTATTFSTNEGDITVQPLEPTSTVTNTAAGPVSIASTNTSTFADVFDFTVTDDGGTPGTDNFDIQISQITITDGAGSGTIADWTDVILEAQLIDNEGTPNTIPGVVSTAPNAITFSAMPNASGDIGYIGDNASKEYRLQIKIDPDLANPTTIDNDNFYFELDTDDIIVEIGSSDFVDNVLAGDGAGEAVFVDVEASEISVLTEPSASVDTDTDLATDAIFEATDENGFRDTDYSLAIANATGTNRLDNTDDIVMTGVPANFVNGLLDLTITTFQYQNEGGDGTLTLTIPGLTGSTATTGAVTVNDVTAPAWTTANLDLDGLSPAQQSQGFNLDVELNERNLTIFWYAMPTPGTQPSQANLESGIGAENNGSFIYTGRNTEEKEIIQGLSPSTEYVVYTFARDADGNNSPIQTTNTVTTIADAANPTISNFTLSNNDGTNDLNTSLFIDLEVDEIATVYWIATETQISSIGDLSEAELKAGLDQNGNPAFRSGSFNVDIPNASFTDYVTSLSQNTTYYIYAVAEDEASLFSTIEERIQTTADVAIVGGVEIGTNATIIELCVGDDYTALDNIGIKETAVDDIAAGQTNAILILTVPDEIEFRTGLPISVRVNPVKGTTGTDVTINSSFVTSNTIFIAYSSDATANRLDSITISGVSVRAVENTTGVTLERSPGIVEGGTADIEGIYGGSGSIFYTFEATDPPIITRSDDLDGDGNDLFEINGDTLLISDLTTTLPFTFSTADANDELVILDESGTEIYRALFSATNAPTLDDYGLDTASFGIHTYNVLVVDDQSPNCASISEEVTITIYKLDLVPNTTIFTDDDTDGTTLFFQTPPGYTPLFSGNGLVDIDYQPTAAPDSSTARFVPSVAGQGTEVITYRLTDNTTGKVFQESITFTITSTADVLQVGQQIDYCDDEQTGLLNLVDPDPTNDINVPSFFSLEFYKFPGAIIEANRVTDDVIVSGTKYNLSDWEIDLSKYTRGNGGVDTIQVVMRVIDDNTLNISNAGSDFIYVYDQPVVRFSNLEDGKTSTPITNYASGQDIDLKGADINYICVTDDPITLRATITNAVDGTVTAALDTAYRLMKGTLNGAAADSIYTFNTVRNFAGEAGGVQLTKTFDPSDPDQDGNIDGTEPGIYRLDFITRPQTAAECTDTTHVFIDVRPQPSVPLLATNLTSIGELVSDVYILEFTSGSTVPNYDVEADNINFVDPAIDDTQAGERINWYSNQAGTIPLNNAFIENSKDSTLNIANAFFGGNSNPTGRQSFDAFFTVTQDINIGGSDFAGCESETRKIETEVYPIPDAPVIANALDYDGGSDGSPDADLGSDRYLFEYCSDGINPAAMTTINLFNTLDTEQPLETYFVVLDESKNPASAVVLSSVNIDPVTDISFAGNASTDTTFYVVQVDYDNRQDISNSQTEFIGSAGDTTMVTIRVFLEPNAPNTFDFTNDRVDYYLCSGETLQNIETPSLGNSTYFWYGNIDAGVVGDPADDVIDFSNEIDVDGFAGRFATQADLVAAGFNNVNNTFDSIVYVYWVTQVTNTNNNTGFEGCESDPVKITITVYPDPPAPVFTADDTYNTNGAVSYEEGWFCEGDLDLAVFYVADTTKNTERTFNWYQTDATFNIGNANVLFSGPKATGSDLRILTATQDTYYFAVTQVNNEEPNGANFNGCESEPAVAQLVINVFDVPEEPAFSPAGGSNYITNGTVTNFYFTYDSTGNYDSQIGNGGFFQINGEGTSDEEFLWYYKGNLQVNGPDEASFDDVNALSDLYNDIPVDDLIADPKVFNNPTFTETFTFKVTQRQDSVENGSGDVLFTGCESDSLSVNINILPVPATPIATDTIVYVCENEGNPTLSITNASAGAVIQWFIGDGDINTQDDLNALTPAQSGPLSTYTPSLPLGITDTLEYYVRQITNRNIQVGTGNFAGSVSAPRQVLVAQYEEPAGPQINFGANMNVSTVGFCEGDLATAVFTAVGNTGDPNITYKWYEVGSASEVPTGNPIYTSNATGLANATNLQLLGDGVGVKYFRVSQVNNAVIDGSNVIFEGCETDPNDATKPMTLLQINIFERPGTPDFDLAAHDNDIQISDVLTQFYFTYDSSKNYASQLVGGAFNVTGTDVDGTPDDLDNDQDPITYNWTFNGTTETGQDNTYTFSELGLAPPNSLLDALPGLPNGSDNPTNTQVFSYSVTQSQFIGQDLNPALNGCVGDVRTVNINLLPVPATPTPVDDEIFICDDDVTGVVNSSLSLSITNRASGAVVEWWNGDPNNGGTLIQSSATITNFLPDNPQAPVSPAVDQSLFDGFEENDQTLDIYVRQVTNTQINLDNAGTYTGSFSAPKLIRITKFEEPGMPSVSFLGNNLNDEDQVGVCAGNTSAISFVVSGEPNAIFNWYEAVFDGGSGEYIISDPDPVYTTGTSGVTTGANLNLLTAGTGVEYFYVSQVAEGASFDGCESIVDDMFLVQINIFESPDEPYFELSSHDNDLNNGAITQFYLTYDSARDYTDQLPGLLGEFIITGDDVDSSIDEDLDNTSGITYNITYDGNTFTDADGNITLTDLTDLVNDIPVDDVPSMIFRNPTSPIQYTFRVSQSQFENQDFNPAVCEGPEMTVNVNILPVPATPTPVDTDISICDDDVNGVVNSSLSFNITNRASGAIVEWWLGYPDDNDDTNLLQSGTSTTFLPDNYGGGLSVFNTPDVDQTVDIYVRQITNTQINLDNGETYSGSVSAPELIRIQTYEEPAKPSVDFVDPTNSDAILASLDDNTTIGRQVGICGDNLSNLKFIVDGEDGSIFKWYSSDASRSFNSNNLVYTTNTSGVATSANLQLSATNPRVVYFLVSQTADAIGFEGCETIPSEMFHVQVNIFGAPEVPFFAANEHSNDNNPVGSSTSQFYFTYDSLGEYQSQLGSFTITGNDLTGSPTVLTNTATKTFNWYYGTNEVLDNNGTLPIDDATFGLLNDLPRDNRTDPNPANWVFNNPTNASTYTFTVSQSQFLDQNDNPLACEGPQRTVNVNILPVPATPRPANAILYRCDDNTSPTTISITNQAPGAIVEFFDGLPKADSSNLLQGSQLTTLVVDNMVGDTTANIYVRQVTNTTIGLDNSTTYRGSFSAPALIQVIQYEEPTTPSLTYDAPVSPVNLNSGDQVGICQGNIGDVEFTVSGGDTNAVYRWYTYDPETDQIGANAVFTTGTDGVTTGTDIRLQNINSIQFFKVSMVNFINNEFDGCETEEGNMFIVQVNVFGEPAFPTFSAVDNEAFTTLGAETDFYLTYDSTGIDINVDTSLYNGQLLNGVFTAQGLNVTVTDDVATGVIDESDLTNIAPQEFSWFYDNTLRIADNPTVNFDDLEMTNVLLRDAIGSGNPTTIETFTFELRQSQFRNQDGNPDACLSDPHTVNINIVPIPDTPVPVEELIEICEDEAAVTMVIANRAPGAQVHWFNEDPRVNPNADTLNNVNIQEFTWTPTEVEGTPGTYTYYVRQSTNVGIDNTNYQGSVSAVSTVTVIVYPNAGVPNSTGIENVYTYCLGDPIENMQIADPQPGVTYSWYADAGRANLLGTTTASNNNFIPGLNPDFSEDIPDTYRYYVTSSINAEGCESDPQEVQIVINDTPVPVIRLASNGSQFPEFFEICVDAEPEPLQGNLETGATGLFSGPGITNGANGTATFDPVAALSLISARDLAEGEIDTVNFSYSLTSSFGCVGTVSAGFVIYGLPEPNFTLSSEGEIFVSDQDDEGELCVDLDPNNLATSTSIRINGFGGKNTGLFIIDDEIELPNSPAGAVLDLSLLEDPTVTQHSHTIRFEFTDGNGCFFFKEKTLILHQNPIVEFDFTDACEGKEVTLTANAVAPFTNDDIDRYDWFIFNPITQSDEAISFGGNETFTTALTFPAQYEAQVLAHSANVAECESEYDRAFDDQGNMRLLSIGDDPEVDFFWEHIIEGEATDIFGTDAALEGFNPVKGVYMDWGDQSAIDTLQANVGETGLTFTTANHIYDQSGWYNAKLYVESELGCIDSLTKNIQILPRYVVTPDNSYQATFESSTNDAVDWFIDLSEMGRVAKEDSIKVSAWELTDISNEGFEGQGWITRGQTGEAGYIEDDSSWIYTPAFDISGMERPMVTFDGKFDFNSNDGVVLQYSTDNGDTWNLLGRYVPGDNQGTGLHWYNNLDIRTDPGQQRANGANNASGWGGQSSLNEKESIRHKLDDIEDKSEVRFRFYFASSSPSSTIGFAFDNFRIVERDRVSLIEQFSNSNARSESAVSKTVNEEINKRLDSASLNNGDLIAINYYTDIYGNDPLFEVNEAGPSARSLFYGINSITSLLDGKVDEAANLAINESVPPWTGADANRNVLSDPKFGIALNLVNSDNDVISVEAAVSPREPMMGKEIRVYFAVIEKVITGLTLPNGETDIRNVFRQFLPTANGQVVTNLEAGATNVFEESWNIDARKVLDPDNLAVVAFVQDAGNSKEIYQAARVDVTNKTAVLGVGDLIEVDDINIYPNPAHEAFTVTFDRTTEEDFDWGLYDQTGRLLQDGQVLKGTDGFRVNTMALPSGVYLLSIGNPDKQYAYQRIIIRH